MAIRKQTWVQKNLGKALLAGSAVIVVIYSLAVVASQGDSKKSVDDVARISRALDKRIQDKSQKKSRPLPEPGKTVAGWKLKIPARDDLPMWIYNREPAIKVTVKKPVDTRPDLFGPVDLVSSVSEDFKVELQWKPDQRTTAEIEGFDVLRWKKGEEKPEKPLGDRLIKGTVFTDSDFDALVPMTSVFYAVRAHTKQDVKQGVKFLESAPLEVKIPDDRSVDFHGEGNAEMAVLYVNRFCKGDWAREKFTVFLGDQVGEERPVKLDDGAKSVKVNFHTDKLLGEIGEEKTVEKVVTKIPKFDDKGKREHDEDGNPEFEEKVREVTVIKEFVVLVDGKGDPEKIWKTKKPLPGEIGDVDPDAPFFDHYVRDLEKRHGKAPNAALKKILYMRIRHLKRAGKKLVGTPEQVDEKILSEEGKLLYDLRWEWLKAKDKESQFPKNKALKKKADDLTWRIKDLEQFLSPKGWDREKEEWEQDRAEAQDHKDFGGRPPAIWAMPEKPKAPKNTKGG